MSGLLTHGDDGGFVHCVICGGDAAGPCARCRSPVCGDCCVLTEGTAGKWAICLRCEKRSGRGLGPGWWVAGFWLVSPLVVLAGLLLLLWWAFG